MDQRSSSDARNTSIVPSWIRTVSTVSWAFVGFILAVGLVVLGLGAVREVVIPIVLSGFLAIVFSPAVGRLAERGVSRAIGALTILVLIVVVFTAAIGAVVIGVIDQRENLADRVADVISEVDQRLENSDLTSVVESVLNGAQGSGSILRDGLGSTVGSAVGTAGGFVSGTVLGAVLLYYLLKDGPSLTDAIVGRRGVDRAERLDRILGDAATSVRSYVRGRTILALVQGTAMGIVAAVAGVPLAFAIAVVNVLGAYVPYIGGFVGGAFAVVMALSVGGVGLALIMLGAAIAISVGLENLLEPALLGNKLALHPIVVLFATVTGGLLVGIVGMIVAAPLVAIGRMLFRELAETGFFTEPATGTGETAETGGPAGAGEL